MNSNRLDITAPRPEKSKVRNVSSYINTAIAIPKMVKVTLASTYQLFTGVEKHRKWRSRKVGG
jgi:hypothetical protein